MKIQGIQTISVLQNRDLVNHNYCFQDFLSKKYLRQIPIQIPTRKCLKKFRHYCFIASSQYAKSDKSFISTCISVKFQSEMVVLKVLQDFAGGTSIHGFCYLVSPKSSSWTKIIWAISLVVALTYATLEMRNSVVGKYDYITRFICRNLNINLFYNTSSP